MIRINLLPVESIKKEGFKDTGLMLIIGVVVLVLVVFGLYFVKKNTLANLNKEIAETEAELIRYQAVVAKVAELKAERAILTNKSNVINGLVGNRLLYPKFMELFASLVPDKVWLTSLNTSSENNNLKLNISAIAFDNYAIADFMTNLQDAKIFSSVELGAITGSGQGKERTFSFSLTVNYQGPGI
ncbi:MAG: PilN domain-containing protein [Elusimicrobiota bacterium]